ncbi:unnamed protein product [Mucor circinelloides]
MIDIYKYLELVQSAVLFTTHATLEASTTIIKAAERKGQQGWQLIPSDKPVGAYVMEHI